MTTLNCILCDGSGWAHAPGTSECHQCQCYPIRRVNFIMEGALIPPRYRNETLDMVLSEGQVQDAALASLRLYRDTLGERLKAGDGVALIGSASRTGKTHLACALARSLATQYDLGYEPGAKYPFLYLNVSEFINAWRTFYAQPKAPDGQGDPGHWDIYTRLMALEQRALSSGFLILDEIGEASGTEFVTQKLYAIVEHRCSHLLPLIFTSNLNWDQMKQRYGDGGARIVGRLQEMTAQFTIQF